MTLSIAAYLAIGFCLRKPHCKDPPKCQKSQWRSIFRFADSVSKIFTQERILDIPEGKKRACEAVIGTCAPTSASSFH